MEARALQRLTKLILLSTRINTLLRCFAPLPIARLATLKLGHACDAPPLFISQKPARARHATRIAKAVLESNKISATHAKNAIIS